jgi:hypothetical protein
VGKYGLYRLMNGVWMKRKGIDRMKIQCRLSLIQPHLRKRRQGRPVLSTWLIVAFTLVLPSTTLAAGEVSQFEVQEYSKDFDVSLDRAEANLETQQSGIAIVAELKLSLGKQYAGVWFDNEAGEFVIPLLPGAESAAFAPRLVAQGLGDRYRLTLARASWKKLEAAQERLDNKLLPLINGGSVQTSLDPRSNAVVIQEAETIGTAREAEIQRLAAEENVGVDIKKKALNRFSVTTRACKTSAPRACGRPLRGGVSLTPDTSGGGFAAVGECSAGFKAMGNGNRYILTAGHCAAKFPKWGSEDANENWHLIGNVAGYTFPGGDWAKISANGSAYWDKTSWPSQVAHYWEDQERPIYYEAYSYLGQYVCLSGNKSGTSCGNVSNLNVTAGEPEAGYPIYHQTEFGQVCVQNGDSGGSVFTGNTALGIFSSSNVTGCTATGYYSEITEATSAMGVSVGTRIGGAPTATTQTPSSVQGYKATANGTVNPNQVETSYHFEYGLTTSYGKSIPFPDGSGGHGGSPVSVNVPLSNLQPGTTYHYRLVATNAAGTSYGGDVQFTTPIKPTPAAIVDGNGIEHVYTRDVGGLLNEWYLSGSTWKHKTWGYTNMMLGTPSAVKTSDGSIWVYYRGTDGALHRWWFNGQNWEERQYGYDGVVAGDPSAVTTSDGSIWVYYRNVEGVLYRWWFYGQEWDDHQYGYAESLAGDSAAVVGVAGNRDVFYIDEGWDLRHWWFKDQNWYLETLGSLN